MGDAAAVSDDIEAFMAALKVFVQRNFHVIEFYFHAVQQGIVIGCAGGDLVQRVDHFHDSVHDPLGEYKAQVSRSRGQGRYDQPLRDAAVIAAPSANQVAEALHNDAAAQHIGKAGDALSVGVAVFEGFRKMF